MYLYLEQEDHRVTEEGGDKCQKIKFFFKKSGGFF